MSEHIYIPSTEDVREAYKQGAEPVFVNGDHGPYRTQSEMGTEFDLWLKRIKAGVWNEGRTYEADQAIQGWNGTPEDNPYAEDA